MITETYIANTSEEDPAVFDARFRRSRRLLYFLASRVLGGDERAGEVVENCFITAASHRPSRFGSEGAFRCWLLRVLIDEALRILRDERDAIPISREVNVGPSPKELRAF